MDINSITLFIAGLVALLVFIWLCLNVVRSNTEQCVGCGHLKNDHVLLYAECSLESCECSRFRKASM